MVNFKILIIDSASKFCSYVGLKTSSEKSCIMTFSKACLIFSWHYNGDFFRVVESATYLGLNLHPKHGLVSSFASRELKLWSAWAMLNQQYAGLRCTATLSLLHKVYEACVPPVAT